MGDVHGPRAVGRVAPVPPLLPGDPGDGHGEDAHDPDDVGYTPPLPPEDRLWRHPSEVASDRAVPAAAPPRPGIDRRTAGLMLVSGIAGATLVVGAVAALGGFDERVVERQVASQTSVLDGIEDGVADVAHRTAPSVAALLVHRGEEQTPASAVAWRPDGYLVTDGPSVTGADEIDVVLHGGEAAIARLVGIDEVTGIAVLQVDIELDAPELAREADPVAVGSLAVAVGASPDGGWDLTVSSGVVAAVGKRLESGDGATHHGMILVDKAFAPGTAGGALVDQRGGIVGIISGASASSGGARFGVATPIDLAGHVADQLVEHGRAEHVWLGLRGTDLDVDEAMGMGLSGGALVEATDDGPARRAGIEPGDVVVSIDGDPTPTMSALIAVLRRHMPGDVVVLEVHRDGEPREVQVTLARKG
ncbi:MAG TPA: hypothetical protein DCS55_06380 [Acidimicrobiaceae bacterium]|nr:hypothetical protein [Acidimicrobiaceae bacterium]